jgi:hypothetical protein
MFKLIRMDGQPKNNFRWQQGILLLVLAFFMVTATGCFGLLPKAPHEEVIAAAKKTDNLREMDYTANLSFQIKSEDPQLATFVQIFNEISIPLRVKVDKNEKRGQLAFGINYKGKDCGNLLLYTDRELISAQSNFLGTKTFFFAWNDLQPLIQDNFGWQVQFTDYFPLLFETKRKTSRQAKAALYDLYTEFYAAHLTAGQKKVDLTITDGKQEETLVCKEIILEMGYEDLGLEASNRYFRALLENEAIISLLKEKITQLVTIAQNNGDLATWPLTEEELLYFRDNIDLCLDELADTLFPEEQLTQAVLQPQMSLQGAFHIDRRGLIRNIALTQVMEYSDLASAEPFSAEIYMDINLLNPKQALTFIDFSEAEMVDVGKLSAEEGAEIGEELLMNLVAQLMVNPLIQDILQLSGLLD